MNGRSTYGVVLQFRTWSVFVLFLAVGLTAPAEESKRIAVLSDMQVGFPDVESDSQTPSTFEMKNGDWVFSVTKDSEKTVLRARSGEREVFQTITPTSVYKRFLFDTEKARFEIVRQEIRIEIDNPKKLDDIEQLPGVVRLKRYPQLGFSIVKVSYDVDPVTTLLRLREEFDSQKARVYTGMPNHIPH